MSEWLTDVELVGGTVTLVPMLPEHEVGLVAAATDGDLFRLWFTSVPSADSIAKYMAEARNERIARRALSFRGDR